MRRLAERNATCSDARRGSCERRSAEMNRIKRAACFFVPVQALRFSRCTDVLCSHVIPHSCRNAASKIRAASIMERFSNFDGDAVKVALARSYRLWMLALLPATLGFGSAVLWIRSMNWPREINSRGLVLGARRFRNWESITKVGVSRNYRDGHISEVRVHYQGGASRIPVGALEEGDKVARAILSVFVQKERLRDHRPGFRRAAQVNADLSTPSAILRRQDRAESVQVH